MTNGTCVATPAVRTAAAERTDATNAWVYVAVSAIVCMVVMSVRFGVSEVIRRRNSADFGGAVPYTELQQIDANLLDEPGSDNSHPQGEPGSDSRVSPELEGSFAVTVSPEQGSETVTSPATLNDISFLLTSAAPAFIVNGRREVVLWSEGMTHISTIALPVGENVDSLPFVLPADREHACSAITSALQQPADAATSWPMSLNIQARPWRRRQTIMMTVTSVSITSVGRCALALGRELDDPDLIRLGHWERCTASSPSDDRGSASNLMVDEADAKSEISSLTEDVSRHGPGSRSGAGSGARPGGKGSGADPGSSQLMITADPAVDSRDIASITNLTRPRARVIACADLDEEAGFARAVLTMRERPLNASGWRMPTDATMLLERKLRRGYGEDDSVSIPSFTDECGTRVPSVQTTQSRIDQLSIELWHAKGRCIQKALENL